MTQWDQMRTALYVHKLGTVSAAADALGVHRATVIRHVDALERALGTPLFYRNSQGYAATDAGLEALRVAKQVDKLFTGMVGKNIKETERLTGRIIFSTLPAIVPFVMPAVRHFCEAHPGSVVEVDCSEALVRLELGEAHVALRAGPKPTEAEYVAQKYCDFGFGLYAHQSYVDRHGALTSFAEMDKHFFVAPPANAKLPFISWVRRHVPKDRILVRANGSEIAIAAIIQGIGIGVLPDWEAERFGELVSMAPLPDFLDESLWLVTHGDVHRTPAIQEFTKTLKSERHPKLRTGSATPAA